MCLHVTGKRADGFHDLQSLVAFADVGDVLTAERASGFALAVDGPFAAGLESEADNLVLRAARTMLARGLADSGARFHLSKNLPVASGIGGGSADAAAAIRALLALRGGKGADGDELSALAATLGSDIPVCLASSVAWMEGRGERVTRLPPLPPVHIVLVNPGITVSTAEVFRRLAIRDDARLAPPAAFSALAGLADYLRATRNDLEAPARALAPAIGSVLDALAREGAVFARMSGSGATCFGLFETVERARQAAASISTAEPGWWSCASQLATAEAAQPIAIGKSG